MLLITPFVQNGLSGYRLNRSETKARVMSLATVFFIFMRNQ